MTEDEWEKVRTLRASDALWGAFGAACKDEGTDRSTVLRRFMAAYAKMPGAKVPRRRRAKPDPE